MDSGRIFKLKMNPRQVEKFQAFFMQNSGLVFEGRRIQEMEKAIARRMIELGFSSFDDYYSHITSQKAGRDEINSLVISLTVGETMFFRTPDQFAALRKYVLPELIEKQAAKDRELNILSAGCATGEETYSLLMLLDELVPDVSSWNIRVVGADINTEYLEAAKQRTYTERKLRLLDPATRRRYFERVSRNSYRINEEQKDRVEWKQFNLNSRDYSPLIRDSLFHLVLCRNVLIYFNIHTIKKVIMRLHDIIKPEGYLMLGYSETLFKISDSFQSLHTPEAFFYQKTGRPAWTAPKLPQKTEPLKRDELLRALGSRPHPRSALKEVVSFREIPARSGGESTEKVPGDEGLQTFARTTKGPGQDEITTAAESGVDGLPQKEPEETEDSLWSQALEMFAREDFEGAQKKFERMIEINPCSARAHLGLGFLYANIGSEDRSRRHAEEAMRYDDLMPELYFLLALLDEKNLNYDMAVENYKRVILLAPEFAMAHFNLANLYLKLKRPRDARREFGNTLAILEIDQENSSLKFSGGLSARALMRFCEMQREKIAKVIPVQGRKASK